MMNKRAHTSTDSAGFSLIEVIMAFGILATTVALSTVALARIHHVSEVGEARQQAMAHLATVSAQLAATPFDTLAAYEPPAALGGIVVDETLITCVRANGELAPIETAARDLDLPNPLHLNVTLRCRNAHGTPFTINAAVLHAR